MRAVNQLLQGLVAAVVHMQLGVLDMTGGTAAPRSYIVMGQRPDVDQLHST